MGTRGDAVTFTLTDAIPGTALYELAKQNYLPKDFEWHKNQLNLRVMRSPVYSTSPLEEEMLSYSCRFKMRFAFYKLFDIQSKEDFKLLFQRIYPL